VESFGRLLAYESPRGTNPRSRGFGYGDLGFLGNMVVLDWHRTAVPGFGISRNIPSPLQNHSHHAGEFMMH